MSKKVKRECTFCHKAGHNQRTCEEKKAAEASGHPVVPTAAPSASSLALVDQLATPQEVTAALVHQPVEFEEAVKQVHANGTTLRMVVREFPGGVAELVLRTTRAGGKSVDLSFDLDAGAKSYELFGWALQLVAARRNLKTVQHRAQTNGAPKVEAHGS